MIVDLNFEPFFIFANPHEQTVIGCLAGFPKEIFSRTRYVLLPDGDKLAYEVTTPRGWKSGDPTVVLIHGLCGSHRSSPLVRLAHKLKRKKIRAIRVNLRGCGSGKGLSRRMYHAGQSDDLLQVLKIIKQETPDSPITVLGYSLGGNIVLKLAGELGKDAPKYMIKAIAICAPLDLRDTVCLMNSPANEAYQRYFMKYLKDDIDYRKRIFPDERYIDIHKDMSFKEFDERYTTVIYGFSSVEDYYKKCSSKNFIPNIRIPCNILIARDDPIVCSRNIPKITFPQNVSVYRTNHGGHMGYVGAPGSKRGFYWMDTLLMEWILEKK